MEIKEAVNCCLSSTESECIAICNAVCDFKNLLDDLKIEYHLTFTVFEDNQSTIKLLKNFVTVNI